MSRCVALVVLVGMFACGKHDDAPVAKTPAPQPIGSAAAESKSGSPCEQLAFAESTPVPEASGAAWLDIDGKPMLVVIADSSHHGGFGLVDPETGATTMQGTLPLGTGASDDLEGIASIGPRLVAITSSGFLREWRWSAGAFQLVAGPYPIGGDDVTCKGTRTNCGQNYEGLALASTPVGACAGYACSKGDGSIYCLAEKDGAFAATGAKIRIVSRGDVLADCAFPRSESAALYVGDNLFGLAHAYRVEHLADPAQVTVGDLGPLGNGFPETIAVDGDVIYRMSDIGGDGPSLMAKFRCPVPGR